MNHNRPPGKKLRHFFCRFAVRPARAVGTNGSRMDDVVTGNMLREHRRSSGAIDAFGRIDIPLCPAIVAAVGAGRLHRGDAVGVAGEVRPGHHDVPVGVCGDPGEHVGVGHGGPAVHAHGCRLSLSQIRRGREEHVLVV